MGLDTSHDCWSGAYSSFMRWREKLMEVAGLPPLMFMEGFFRKADAYDPIHWARKGLGSEDGFNNYYACLPIKWEALKPDPLHILLNHSDCDGEIRWEDAEPIAKRLEEIADLMPAGEGGGHIGNWKEKTLQFAKGLRAAAQAKENVEFH